MLIGMIFLSPLEAIKGYKGKVLKTSLTVDKEEALQKILAQDD